MNEILAIIIALLVYPGVIFGLLAAALFGWVRGMTRMLAYGYDGSAPLFAPREFSRRLRQNSTLPEGVVEPAMQILPVAAIIAPLLVLIFLPLPGNRAAQSTMTIDLIAATILLLGMPLARAALAWVIPSPYTRIAAMRGLRRLLGYLAPLTLAIVAAAIISGSTSVQTIASTQFAATIHPNQQSLANAARIVAGLAYLACLPVLARLTPLRTGQGSLDLVGGELTELSGRELLIMRLAEWLQLVAALALGIALFVLPFFHTDAARALAAIGFALIVTAVLGIWEGIGSKIVGRDDMAPPFSVWLGTPTLVGIFAILLVIFAQRGS